MFFVQIVAKDEVVQFLDIGQHRWIPGQVVVEGHAELGIGQILTGAIFGLIGRLAILELANDVAIGQQRLVTQEFDPLACQLQGLGIASHVVDDAVGKGLTGDHACPLIGEPLLDPVGSLRQLRAEASGTALQLLRGGNRGVIAEEAGKGAVRYLFRRLIPEGGQIPLNVAQPGLSAIEFGVAW